MSGFVIIFYRFYFKVYTINTVVDMSVGFNKEGLLLAIRKP